MDIAYGDHQVSMYAGAAEARSIGADAYEPGGTPASALTPGGGRNANANLFYGLKPVPTNGTLHRLGDRGLGQRSRAHAEPAGRQPRAADQRSDQPGSARGSAADAGGAAADLGLPAAERDVRQHVCAGQPCHSYDYVP